MTDFIISKNIPQGTNDTPGKVTIIYQINFSETNNDFNKEILETLKFNVNNEMITKIILLNKKLYTPEQLGITSKKIKQVKLDKNLTFKDVFNQVYGDSLTGYIIISNQNIFFDDTLKNLEKTELANKKQFLALNRYEYNNKSLKRCSIYGPRSDSQDTFIFHTNNIIDKKMRRALNFNIEDFNSNCKFLFILNMLGYEIYNEPNFIRSYHNGKEKLNELQKEIDEMENSRDTESGIRNKRLEVPGPYLYVVPKVSRLFDSNYYPIKNIMSPLKMTYEKYTNNGELFNDDIKKFHDSLKGFLERNEQITVFKMNPLWCNIVYFLYEVDKAMVEENSYAQKIQTSLLSQNIMEANKKGILFEKIDETMDIANCFINMIETSDVTLHYSPITEVLLSEPEAHKEHLLRAKKTKNKQINQSVLFPTVTSDGKNILELIKNKKILVVTHYQEQLDKQKLKLEEIWNFKAFENCEIKTINAPIHNKDSKIEDKQLTPSELINAYIGFMVKNASEVIDGIDLILLTECHFNPILMKVFKSMGKSVIDAGLNTELYFGLYNDDIIGEKKELLLTHSNKNWVKV